MSTIRYASFRVLSATKGGGGSSAFLSRTAHRADFSHIEAREGYIYVRSRAISSRTNDNFDTFPAEEIKKAWRTFIGKPVFVNHHNDDPKRARGVIVDAVLHEDVSPFGEPDTWVEVLMEIDAVRFPKLAKMVLSGDIDKTSMGCSVALSRCSFCGNEAESPIDFCKHVKSMKGRRVRRTTASGTKEDVLVSEICLGISFFENSLLVETPADPTASSWVDRDLSRAYLSEDVSPRLAVSDRPHSAGRDTELSTDAGEGHLPSTGTTDSSVAVTSDHGHLGSDLGDDFLGEQSVGVVRSTQASASLDHVSGVVSGQPQNPVRRVVADRVVASVSDNLAFGDGANQGFVSPSVRPDAGPLGIVQGESSVPATESSADPRPTLPLTPNVDLGSVPLHDGLGADESLGRRVNAHAHGQQGSSDVRTASLDWDASLITDIEKVTNVTYHHALDEQIAPPKVDTLRDSVCSVCGSSDSIVDGVCQTCGFEESSMFADPDTLSPQIEDMRDDGKPAFLQCNECHEKFPTMPPERRRAAEGQMPDDLDKTSVLVGYDSDGSAVNEDSTCPVCEEGTLVPGSDEPEEQEGDEDEAFDREVGESDDDDLSEDDEAPEEVDGDDEDEDDPKESKEKTVSARRRVATSDRYELYVGDGDDMPVAYFPTSGEAFDAAELAGETNFSVVDSHTGDIVKENTTASRRTAIQNCGCPDDGHLADCPFLTGGSGMSENDIYEQERRRMQREEDGLYEGRRRQASHPSHRRVADYNGWPNRETWSAFSWLANDYDVYQSVVKARSAQELKSLYESIPDRDKVDESQIDWDAVYEGFSDDRTASRRSAHRRTAAYSYDDFPLVDNPNFPGEKIPSCPKCGGYVVDSSASNGMPGRLETSPIRTCKNCGAVYVMEDNNRMTDQFGRYLSSHRRTAISLTNIGKTDDPLIFKGKDPSGKEVKFKVTQKESDDLKAVLYSDMAINFSGVDVDESEIIKDASFRTAISVGDVVERKNRQVGTDPAGETLTVEEVWSRPGDGAQMITVRTAPGDNTDVLSADEVVPVGTTASRRRQANGIPDNNQSSQCKACSTTRAACRVGIQNGQGPCCGECTHGEYANGVVSRRQAAANWGPYNGTTINGYWVTTALNTDDWYYLIYPSFEQSDEGQQIAGPVFVGSEEATKAAAEAAAMALPPGPSTSAENESAWNRTSSFSRGPAPAWLNERNNDGYGTPKNHEFWNTVDFEDVNGWRIFNKDGLWYGYKLSQNAWSNGATDKSDILSMADPGRQVDVWASRKSPKKESKMDAQERRRMKTAIEIQARRGQQQQKRIAALEGVLREVIAATGVKTPKAASLVLASEDKNGDGQVAETKEQALPESTDVESEGKVIDPPPPVTNDDPNNEGGTLPDNGFNKSDDPESVGSGDGVTNESDSERTFTSMRLARLRIEAGVESGDDLTLGQAIANSSVSMESIRNEVETLSKVVAHRTASADVSRPRPIPARTAQSQTASLAALVAASSGGGAAINGGSQRSGGSLISDTLI